MAAQKGAPAQQQQQLPSKKRRRTTTDSQPSSSAAPSPAPASPAPSPASAASAAPLSAVAARRAAREAAQAAAAQPPPPPSSAVQPPPAVEDAAGEADGASSSADEQETVAAARRIRSSGVKKTAAAADVKGKGKGKAAAPAPSRYFAAAAEDEKNEEDVMLLDQGEDDEDEGDLSPPEGLDADEQEALGPVNGSAADEGPATPKSSRRRREKSAFVDPYCVSAFQAVEGVSAARTEIIDPSSGAKCQAVLYALQEGENLVLHGAFLLAPIFGSVTSLGSTLTGSSPSSPPDGAEDEVAVYAIPSAPDAFHPFFAPSSHPLPPIFALPPSNGYSPRTVRLSSGEQFDLSRFAAAVVVLDHETGIEGVGRALVVGGMGCASGMWPKGGNAKSLVEGKTWKLITSPTPSLTSLRPIPHWDHAISAALPPLQATAHDAGRFVALVEGPKRVGKSTMSRMLSNALLDRYEAVAYLDTDLGQPEFTPPGFLSLHVLRRPALGPSFTHLAIPLSAQYLGSTSPVSDPAAYISAAQALLETYALEVEYPLIDEPDRMSAFSRRRGGRFARMRANENGEEEEAAERLRKIRERVPLVINTQGWVKGLGADLLAKLKAASRPTHVFSFASGEDVDGAPFDPYGEEVQHPPYQLFSLPPAPPSPLESKWAAADYRILSLASYFHAVYPSPSSANSAANPLLPLRWYFSLSLAASTPSPFSWSADADPAQIHSVHLVAPGTANGEVKYEHVLHALNGAVVALVAPPSAAESARPARPFPYDPTSPAPSLAKGSRALGLALVHSISPSLSTLNILTPLPPSLLASVAPLSIVRGALELPTALMLDYSAGTTDGEREKGICGVPWGSSGKEGREAGEGVPFLVKGEQEGGVGAVGGRRRVRRNLMRRGQA